MGEYDPLLGTKALPESDDLERVRDLFVAASRPFLASPRGWLAWAVLLPGAALATPAALAMAGPVAVLGLWSGIILFGGAIELTGIRRGQSRHASTPLGGWVLNVQGNLSVVALVLSLALLWAGEGRLLPALWLLLLGHSFFQLGGLAFPPFRAYGLLYQLGGAVALWPQVDPYIAFAVATLMGNLWMAWSVWRR